MVQIHKATKHVDNVTRQHEQVHAHADEHEYGFKAIISGAKVQSGVNDLIACTTNSRDYLDTPISNSALLGGHGITGKSRFLVTIKV